MNNTDLFDECLLLLGDGSLDVVFKGILEQYPDVQQRVLQVKEERDVVE